MILCVTISGVVYPLLHETGHLLAGLIMKYEIISYGYQPTLYLIFRTDDNLLKIIIVAINGIIFPIFIYFILPKKHFVLWLNATVIVFVNLIVSVTSIVNGIIYVCSGNNLIDDIISVCMLSPKAIWCYNLMLCLMNVVMIYALIKSKPYKMVYEFLKK